MCDRILSLLFMSLPDEWKKIAFIIARKRNNVVVSFGTLKVLLHTMYIPDRVNWRTNTHTRQHWHKDPQTLKVRTLYTHTRHAPVEEKKTRRHRAPFEIVFDKTKEK